MNTHNALQFPKPAGESRYSIIVGEFLQLVGGFFHAMFEGRRLPVFAGALVAACFWIGFCGVLPIRAQERLERSPGPFRAEERLPKIGQYLGASSCASSNCHGSVQPRKVYNVKQNEYFIWLKQDKHATRAYSILLNDRSARIARNMKLKDPPNQSAKCLDCHTLHVSEDLYVRPLDLAEGISCEACHGPAGGWIAKHTEDGWTHDQSVKASMTDLRNLVTRAERCLTCHLGDTQKGVDHELIASGHPELIFELDNYSAAMPAHWTPLADKRDKERERERNGVRAWAVGQAVTFREGILQLARRARSENWPEFSEMNCSACHHSLKGGKWRQVDGYTFKAGLPRWSLARFAVLRHIVSVFAPEERMQLDDAVERLSGYIAKMNTPPKIVAETATGLAETMGRVVPKIVQSPIDGSITRKLVGRIASDGPFLVKADLHSVKQAVMAINTLMSSLARSNPTLADREITQVVDRLYDDVRDQERFDPDLFLRHMGGVKRLIK